MSVGNIWWEQIGSSLTLLNQLTELLRDCQSAVLQLPQSLPWREVFYEAVDSRRRDGRRLQRLAWKEYDDPGEMVLAKLCDPRIHANYWPGQPAAEYLGKLGPIALCEHCVWITGIHSQTDLQKWTEFVRAYERAAAENAQRAVFLLEYEGTAAPNSGLVQLEYRVEEWDCRVFALEYVNGMKNVDAGLRSYQAELALHITGGNPEFCELLLAEGERFLKKPAETAAALGSAYRDDVPEALSRYQSAVWEAAVGLFFPILERFRMRLIKAHSAELSTLLTTQTVRDSHGGYVKELYDFELGTLWYVAAKPCVHFSEEEYKDLCLFRDVRNLLAHCKPVPYGDAVEVLKLSASLKL